MVAYAGWINPLISGAAGVFGALVGGGVLLRVARGERQERRENEHRAALSEFWAAVHGFASFVAGYPQQSKNPFQQAMTNVELHIHEGRILERLNAVTDRFWQADGRLRAVASPDELAVMDDLEGIIGTFKLGEPFPDEAWAKTIPRLRALLERSGGAATPVA
jgi:hypothetical protein